jgi:hypothetical protein
VDRLELRAATRALLNLQNNGTPSAVPDPWGFVDASDVTEQLNQARASVLHLKEQLYDTQAMHGLLLNETSIAYDRIKRCTDASSGTFTEGWVTMEVTGPSSTSMDIYTLHAMLNVNDDMPPSEATKFTKDFLFPVHPEHYQLITTNGIGITETWAGIPTSSYLDALAIPPPFVVRERDLSYQLGITARGYLGDADKTTVTWTLQQTRQTASGVDFNLRVWFPSACPPEYIHDQVEHLCVEYRNGLHLLAAYFGL